MKISSQEEYGLRCLMRLARVGQSESLSIPEIAVGEGLSQPYVGKLLAVLRQAGIIESVRGRTGGYRLAMPPEDITLGVARGAVAVLELAAQTAEQGNVNALSDSGSAANLAMAALKCAALNVRANADVVQDQAQAGAWLEALNGLEARAAAAMAAVERHLRERH